MKTENPIIPQRNSNRKRRRGAVEAASPSSS
jgi:hypothetical protein